MYQKNYKKSQRKAVRGASAYYTDGSAAYEVQPVYEPKAPAPRRKKQPVKRTKAAVQTFSWIYTIKVFMLFAMVFVGCMMIMSAHALLMKERLDLQTHRDQLAAIKNENVILSADISQQIDLEVIREKATKSLGMAEPQEYQKVYIEVPRQSYTVQFATEDSVPKKSDAATGLLSILTKD